MNFALLILLKAFNLICLVEKKYELCAPSSIESLQILFSEGQYDYWTGYSLDDLQFQFGFGELSVALDDLQF